MQVTVEGSDGYSTALEILVARVVNGDDAAWNTLWSELDQRLHRQLRNPQVVGRLAASEDECRNIFVELMARLRADEFRRLRVFLHSKDERPELDFVAWLRVVAKRVAIDYMRGHDQYIDRRRNRNPDSAAGRWVNVGELPRESQLGGARPAYTNRGAAMKLLRYAYTQLAPDQLAALELWIIQTPFSDIARELELDTPRHAEKLVRAALEKLRRHFRKQATP